MDLSELGRLSHKEMQDKVEALSSEVSYLRDKLSALSARLDALEGSVIRTWDLSVTSSSIEYKGMTYSFSGSGSGSGLHSMITESEARILYLVHGCPLYIPASLCSFSGPNHFLTSPPSDGKVLFSFGIGSGTYVRYG